MTRITRILAALAALVVAALLLGAAPASAAPPPGPVDIAQPETPPVPDPPAPGPGLDDLAPCTQDCGPTAEPGPPLLPDGGLVAAPCPTHGCGSDPGPNPGPDAEPTPGPAADPTRPADVVDIPLPTRIDAGGPPSPSPMTPSPMTPSPMTLSPMTLSQMLLILAAAILAVTSAAAAWMSRASAHRR